MREVMVAKMVAVVLAMRVGDMTVTFVCGVVVAWSVVEIMMVEMAVMVTMVIEVLVLMTMIRWWLWYT